MQAGDKILISATAAAAPINGAVRVQINGQGEPYITVPLDACRAAEAPAQAQADQQAIESAVEKAEADAAPTDPINGPEADPNPAPNGAPETPEGA